MNHFIDAVSGCLKHSIHETRAGLPRRADQEVTPLTLQIEGGPEPSILSTYEDATQTYELTWAIRNSSEINSKKSAEKYGVNTGSKA